MFIHVIMYLIIINNYFSYYQNSVRPVSGPSRSSFLPSNNVNSKYGSGSVSGSGNNYCIGIGEKQGMTKNQLKAASQGAMRKKYIYCMFVICYLLFIIFLLIMYTSTCVTYHIINQIS